MTRPAQLSAAQRQYESESPDEPDNFTDSAINIIAACMADEAEVSELLTELYAAMPDVLHALSKIPNPRYDVEALLRRLRSLDRAIEDKADDLRRVAMNPPYDFGDDE